MSAERVDISAFPMGKFGLFEFIRPRRDSVDGHRHLILRQLGRIDRAHADWHINRNAWISAASDAQHQGRR
jgi:hypothetical protein